LDATDSNAPFLGVSKHSEEASFAPAISPLVSEVPIRLLQFLIITISDQLDGMVDVFSSTLVVVKDPALIQLEVHGVSLDPHREGLSEDVVHYGVRVQWLHEVVASGLHLALAFFVPTLSPTALGLIRIVNFVHQGVVHHVLKGVLEQTPKATHVPILLGAVN